VARASRDDAGRAAVKDIFLDTPFAAATERSMPDRMRRQTEDIIRYYGELNRRVANAGMESLTRLLEVHRQLEMAVAEVGSEELDWVSDEMKRLLDELVQMDAKLQKLRELKMMMNGVPASDDNARRRSHF
jgi:hypothetical protein